MIEQASWFDYRGRGVLHSAIVGLATLLAVCNGLSFDREGGFYGSDNLP
jgi:hypothetical protein